MYVVLDTVVLKRHHSVRLHAEVHFIFPAHSHAVSLNHVHKSDPL